jgi:hypothetical protein
MQYLPYNANCGSVRGSGGAPRRTIGPAADRMNLQSSPNHCTRKECSGCGGDHNANQVEYETSAKHRLLRH